MACESPPRQLEAYLDGELPAPDARIVDEHLRTCLSCAADALRHVQLRRAVVAAGNRYQPSAALRARITNKFAASAPQKGRWHWAILTVPVLVVLLVIVSADVYMAREKARQQRLYSELADLHVAALASANPVDVTSTDRHTVKPWFEGKIPFSFNLPDLQGSDFVLAGGRVTYLVQNPGAQLIYRLRKHNISVFILQDRGEPAISLASGPVSALSFNIESWTRNGLRYFVIGDVGAGDIEALSKLLRDAA